VVDSASGAEVIAAIDYHHFHSGFIIRMQTMPSFRIIIFVLLCCASVALHAQPETQADEVPVAPALSLQQLTEAADLVLVAQVLDTDYVYVRKFPNDGTAYLKPLVQYKLSRPLEDIIEVYEQGFHPGECYFDNPTVFEEGRRFLLFLVTDPDDDERYRGLPQGCALEVLVTRSNSYALRIPATGMNISDPLEELAAPMDFADSYALVEEENLKPETRDRLLESGLLEVQGEQYRYTHGISLGEVRRLLGPNAVTLDRSLKR
jgi:hypothetical protein